MTSPWRGSDTPEPPTSTVLLSDQLVVHRLNGVPKDPADGRHRRVVVFTGPTVTRGELVGLLLDAAERLASSHSAIAESP